MVRGFQCSLFPLAISKPISGGFLQTPSGPIHKLKPFLIHHPPHIFTHSPTPDRSFLLGVYMLDLSACGERESSELWEASIMN